MGKNGGPFSCDSCDRSFSSIPGLQQHIRDKHHNLPTKAPTAQAPPPAQKPQVQTQREPVPTPSTTLETIACEHCLTTFASSESLSQHKIRFHSWRCVKCPTLPPFENGTAWQVHFNEVHPVTGARTGKVTDTKGKEVPTHTKEGKTNERSCDVDHEAITKVQSPRASGKLPAAGAQSAETLPKPSSSGLSNVKNVIICGLPLEMLTSSLNWAEIPSSTSGDKAESQPAHHTTLNLEDLASPSDGHDLLSSQGPTLDFLVEIDPEPRRNQDGVIYEIASDTWSPATTASSVGTSESGEDDTDMSPSDSSRHVNRSSQRKVEDIIVPPRVPKLGERESRNLSSAIVTGKHSRDEPNDQKQNGLDGATPSPTNSEQYEGARSNSPVSTTFSSRDEGRDTNQVSWSGAIPHDPLRPRRPKPGWPEVHFECRICLSDPTPSTNLTATHCGHLFCYECIATEVLRTSRCPVCKNVLAVYCLFKLDVVS